MKPLVLEIDTPPLAGWPGEEIDHTGFQMSILENKPLVAINGLLNKVYWNGSSWNIRLREGSAWSDGRPVKALHISDRLEKVAVNRFGWPLQMFSHQGFPKIRTSSPLELEISGIPESFDLNALLQNPVFTPRRRGAVTGSYQSFSALPSIGGAWFKSTSPCRNHTKVGGLVLTNLNGAVDNITLWKKKKIDITCTTGTFPDSLQDFRELPDWVERQSTISMHLLLNPKIDIFQNLKKRRAVAGALRRENIVEAAGHLADALELPSDILIAPDFRYFTTGFYDIINSNFGRKKISLLCSDFIPNPQVAICVAEQLKEIGLEVKVEVLSWLDFVSRISAGKYQSALVLIPLSWPSPMGAVLQGFAAGYAGSWLEQLKTLGDGYFPSWQQIEAHYQDVVPTVPLFTLRAGTLMSECAREHFSMGADGLIRPIEYDNSLYFQRKSSM